jgi:hypothetical protein
MRSYSLFRTLQSMLNDSLALLLSSMPNVSCLGQRTRKIILACSDCFKRALLDTRSNYILPIYYFVGLAAGTDQVLSFVPKVFKISYWLKA